MRAHYLCLAVVALGLVSACGDGGGAKISAKPGSALEKSLLAGLPPRFQAADLSDGEEHFSLCLSCHSIIRGAPDMTGPNLHGVFGRRAGAKPGYAYSDALKAKGVVWSADTLDAWLSSPQAYAPGTKMSYPGIRDPAVRRDVVAYLKVASERE